MSKYEEASLILKLYELRREPLMREARNWFTRDFYPESMADYEAALWGEHSAHLRMVTSYWEMAATLVNHGAISPDLFVETSGEALGVFARVEMLVPEIRGMFGPGYFKNLEKLVDDTPDGRKKTAQIREMMKMIREKASARTTS